MHRLFRFRKFFLHYSCNVLFILLCFLSLINCFDDTVHINFSKKFNETKLTKRYFYLSPTSDGILIDNRIREINSDNSNLDTSGFYQVHNTNKQLSNKLRIESDLYAGFVKINEMACENSAANVYFRASLSSLKNVNQPLIENINNDFCKIEKLSNNDYRVNFNRDQFLKCGIVNCSDGNETFYCLTVKFPYISGLKMKEDFSVILQCQPRERIVSHTKRFDVKALDAAARMIPRVAIGGYKNSFETDVGLYRRTFGSDNVFNSRIETGGTVILGEQLLLRVAIKEGDGWHFSKIAEVKVHQIEKTRGQKTKVRTMWMLDSNGCVNPQVSEICFGGQYKASSLENYLLFETFMFDNMKDNDEMVLNVRAVGCVDGLDCALNCPSSHPRKTRSLLNNRTTGWKSDVSFKILTEKNNDKDDYIHFTLLISYILSGLLFSSFIILVWMLNCILKERK